MNPKPFIDWKFNVWPDCLQSQVVRYWPDYSVDAVFGGQSILWNYSFAIGFFGFHYIRAAKEQDPVLKKESSTILQKLIVASNLDSRFLDSLKAPQDWEFLDFWDDVIKEISITLGKSQGPASQQMVELGFWLAAGYSGLVEEFKSDNDKKITRYLNELEKCLSDLFKSSLQAGIPESLIKPLKESNAFLKRSKNSEAATKCIKKLRVAINCLLSVESQN